jgi:hypothetical protein
LRSGPVGTAFTYQGYLPDGGSPANGTYDFIFVLYDAATYGNYIGGLYRHDVQVADGVFTVQLGFASDAFTGDARYLEIQVRPGDSTGIYQPLSPRQELTAAPYALGLRPGADVAGDRPGDSILCVENSSNADQSYGLYRHASATTGTNYTYGVYGQSSAPNGTGVYGWADHTGVSAEASGVVGHTMAGNGRGVYGLGAHSTGRNFGVYGDSWWSGGFGAYFKNTAGGPGLFLEGSAGVAGDVGVSGDAQLGGDVRQDRWSDGLVTAAVYVSADGSCVRQFNHGGGIPITCSRTDTGAYLIDFNFRVHDRFALATCARPPGCGSAADVLVGLRFDSAANDRVKVTAYYPLSGHYVNCDFILVIF